MPPSLEQAILAVHQLPSIPAAVQQVLGYLDDEHADPARLEQAIARDQALVARLLRMANSAFYGGTNQVQSIHEAVLVLGISNLRMIVMTTMMTSLKFPKATDEVQMQTMFRHGIAVAICAYVLGRNHQVNPNQAFLAGILHDVGKLALISSYPDIYAQASALRQDEDLLMVDAERRIFGFDHADIGSALCLHWHLPLDICNAIGSHHNLVDFIGAEQSSVVVTPLMEVVHLANVIAHALDLGTDSTAAVPRISESTWVFLAGSQEQLMVDFAEIHTTFRKLVLLANA